MSVPLDRLYHYLEGLCSEDTLIYRWLPHGSKNLDDLKLLRYNNEPESILERFKLKHIICHDQEPLSYNFYTFEQFYDPIRQSLDKIIHQHNCTIKDTVYDQWIRSLAKYHLRTKLAHIFNMHDKIMLCHSEKNSKELELYEQNGFVGVYYWSHALIARDWFRFAQHDRLLSSQSSKFQYDFLIYNRAWSGSREYRLKFTELVVSNDLVSSCNMRFNPTDGDCYYQTHDFKNPRFKPSLSNLESYFSINTADSSCSADYNNEDYNSAAIEVVLETLYDDTRLHLTEKTLRPIACGKPFIILSSPGILEYLQSYGFKTFGDVINEDYDKILDPLERMQTIIHELKRISLLSQDQKTRVWAKLYEITKFNKNYFFSSEFHNKISDEFVTNFKIAEQECMANMSGRMFELGQLFKSQLIKKD